MVFLSLYIVSIIETDFEGSLVILFGNQPAQLQNEKHKLSRETGLPLNTNQPTES